MTPLTPLQEDQICSVLEHPGWPMLEEMLFRDAQDMLGMSLVVQTNASAGVQSALKKIGLDIPQNQEEQVRTYLALRAVMGYVTEKKRQLDKLKMLQQERVRAGIEQGHITPEAQTTLRGN